MKQDGKRLSKQEWEIDYVRKIAKELKLEAKDFTERANVSKRKLVRVCNAVLKFVK